MWGRNKKENKINPEFAESGEFPGNEEEQEEEEENNEEEEEFRRKQEEIDNQMKELSRRMEVLDRKQAEIEERESKVQRKQQDDSDDEYKFQQKKKVQEPVYEEEKPSMDSYIISAQMIQPEVFQYTIETNKKLRVGHCSISQ